MYVIEPLNQSDKVLNEMFDLCEQVTKNWSEKVGLFGYDRSKFQNYFKDMMIDKELNPLLYKEDELVGFLPGKIVSTFSLLGIKASLWAPIIKQEHMSQSSDLLENVLSKLKKKNVSEVRIFAGRLFNETDRIVEEFGFKLEFPLQTSTKATPKMVNIEAMNILVKPEYRIFEKYTPELESEILPLLQEFYGGKEVEILAFLEQQTHNGNPVELLKIDNKPVAVIFLKLQQEEDSKIGFVNEYFLNFNHPEVIQISLSIILQLTLLAEEYGCNQLHITRKLPLQFIKKLSTLGYKSEILAGEYVLQMNKADF